jgi:hypothetical protein
MVSDAARAWVSPYWQKSYGHVETTISLLNPGFWSANVKVIFHWKGGNVLAANQETIPPESIAMFEPPEAPEADGYGWVSIVSDRPVLPWGHIKYGGGQDGVGATNVQMTFGRWEWVLHVPEHSPLP